MADIRWNADAALAVIMQAAKRGLDDCLQDLANAAEGAAPHDKGFLDRSWDIESEVKNTEFSGVVSFGVNEKSESGNVSNYAIWIHEGTYNLGPGSIAKSGGDSGLSGNHYPVGNKFLERTFNGESKTYEKHIADEVKKELK
jgi:hypothetical protein